MPPPLKLDPDLKARLEAIARAERRPVESLIRDAVRLYVEREEGRVPTHLQDWTSFADEIADTRPSDAGPIDPMRRYAEAQTPYEKFMALAGAGTAISTFKSREDIDAHIRWLRDAE